MDECGPVVRAVQLEPSFVCERTSPRASVSRSRRFEQGSLGAQYPEFFENVSMPTCEIIASEVCGVNES